MSSARESVGGSVKIIPYEYCTTHFFPTKRTIPMLLHSHALLLLLLKTANGVVVTIQDAANSKDPPVGHRRFHLKDISWHGSHIQGVALHRTNYDDHWTMTAPLVYALPNSGCLRGLMNEQDVGGNIVLFDRGEDVTMPEQMYSAQHVGAAAVVIVDYPNANGKQTALQVALRADHELWKRLTIPAVIVDFDRGERLKSR